MNLLSRAFVPSTLVLLTMLAACSDDGTGSGDTDAGTTVAPDGAVTLADGAVVDPVKPSGDGGTGVAPSSSGCGKTTTAAPSTWVKRTLTVKGAPRDVFVFLPAGYDPARKYPVVYQLHGCSTAAERETNVVPIEKNSGAEAILVRGRAAGNCWETAETGPDVPYFDAMLEDVEGAFCVSTERRFVTGYSSGSFLAHRLACIRGDKLRGVATIAGGQAGSDCKGSVAALLIHDANDKTVNISQSETTRDSHLKRNGCASPPTSTPTKSPPCVEYVGCNDGKPVVWCPTAGKDHDRQDALAAPIFWSFLSSLK